MKKETDDIFKALADPSRRKVLDIAKQNPGITVNEMTDQFDFTRYAVMKHLKILEDCSLIVSKKEGKFRMLYMNAVPIQTIYDRWISKYSAHFAGSLTKLKYQLEKGDEMSNQNPEYVFVVYIKSTIEKVWEALTNKEMTKQYYYGMELKSDLKEGSKIEYHGKNKEGEHYIPVAGEIVEIIPNKKLSHTFTFIHSDDKPSRATYEIEESEGLVKLTLTHDQFEGETETYNSVREGWPLILSGLKTYLETNEPINK